VSESSAVKRVRIRQQSDLRRGGALVQRVNAQARRLGWAAMGALARPPTEKEWIQVQFYHWVLEDQREIFRRQLEFLRRYGDFISLDDAVTALGCGARIGGRYFCVTFDDGFKNSLTNAVPVLSELEIPAAFFLPTKYIGLDLEKDWEEIALFYQRSWSEFEGVFEFLDWDECRQIAKAGFTIGSHTHLHQRLTALPWAAAEAELRISKHEIERQLGVRCRHFCCPWGKAHRDFEPAVHPEMARRLGYDSFLTTEGGLSLSGDSPFHMKRVGCEPDHHPAMMKYALFSPLGSLRTGRSRPALTPDEEGVDVVGTTERIGSSEGELVRLARFPHPFQAAFTLASDVDGSSVARFRAIHALICGRGIIQPDSTEWQTLGLKVEDARFEQATRGFSGLGLDFADSFFLVGDRTTFGMYRQVGNEKRFQEDQQDGTDCRAFIQERIRQGEIDSFHAFLHHTREQVKPLLKEFYRWCDHEAIRKPSVWINHSLAVTPSGLCPNRLQPNRLYRLARLSARGVVGPLLGRKRFPLHYAFARYQGDKPSSPYYINDLLAANGLRYVWLNVDDLGCNRVAVSERVFNGRHTILEPVTMDDGVRYYRFERCYGKPSGRFGGESYLRDSADGFDGSCLITEDNLAELCRRSGSCILYTHWAHSRSFPISQETIGRFALLRRWRDEGKIWVTSTSRLLEWTRRRTFLRVSARRERGGLVLELGGVEDPIFGRESVDLADLNGLCLKLSEPFSEIRVAVGGKLLNPMQVHRSGHFCWLDASNNSRHEQQ